MRADQWVVESALWTADWWAFATVDAMAGHWVAWWVGLSVVLTGHWTADQMACVSAAGKVVWSVYCLVDSRAQR